MHLHPMEGNGVLYCVCLWVCMCVFVK